MFRQWRISSSRRGRAGQQLAEDWRFLVGAFDDYVAVVDDLAGFRRSLLRVPQSRIGGPQQIEHFCIGRRMLE
jgi:hypothetical protein